MACLVMGLMIYLITLIQGLEFESLALRIAMALVKGFATLYCLMVEMRILGVLYLFTPLFPAHMLLFILIPVVFLALYLIVYSYVLYQAIEQAGQGRG